MNDNTILGEISALVAREHTLRAEHTTAATDDERSVHRELREVEVELDRCWDLLRQRRAKREFGDNPDSAASRPAATVESYWQ
jgi:hypothetical protein